MSTETSLSSAFESLVGEILIANGFLVSANVQIGRYELDYIAEYNSEKFAVEVKYYRTARAQVSLIQAAAVRLLNKQKTARILKGMLIVACYIDPELRFTLEESYGVVVVDRTDLYNWSQKLPSLMDRLVALFETKETIFGNGRDISYLQKNSLLPSIDVPTEDSMGTDLLHELRNLKHGKSAWAKYEDLCERILRYLFSNDLLGWHAQKRTDDGLNRYDFVCRVRPTTDFWKFVIENLNSRYVLFEFKNYSSFIKQGQILTTEKYLLEKALRRMALIFCRIGADKGAKIMTQGAMREDGKLMVVIDDEMVCKMLVMKQNGEDPSDFLFELVDEFLLSLPR